MKITGQILKENRLQKGLSLSEVSSIIKINTRVLEAMEEGRLDKLPAKSFLKGFIRSYAKYLELDIDQVMQTYNEEIGEQPTTKKIADSSENNTNNDSDKSIDELRGKSSSAKIFMAVGITLLLILIIGVRRIVEKYEREKESVPHNVLTEIETSVSTAPNEHRQSVQLKLGPQKQQLDQNKKGEVEKEHQAQLEKEKAEKEHQAQLEKEKAEKEHQAQLEKEKAEKERQAQLEKEKAEKERQAQLEKEKAEKERQAQLEKEKAEKNKKPALNPQEIILEALDNIEVKFKIDNNTVKTQKIEADKVHVFKAKKFIELDLKDGGAVNLIYNGKDIGVPGDLGQPLVIKFPRGQ